MLAEEAFDIDIEEADDLAEVSGWAALVLLVLGNVGAVLGLLLRAAARLGLAGSRALAWLLRLQRTSRKYQTPVHGTLNLLALAAACLHFARVAEQDSLLLVAALGLMAVFGVSGLLLRVAGPWPMLRQAASRLHRHPVTLGMLAVLIVVGHWVAD